MRRALAAVAVVLAALTGCGGGDTATNDTATASVATVADASASTQRIPTGTIAEILNPASTVTVRDEPSREGKARGAALPGRHARYGTPLILPVEDEQSGWLRVALPGRPNGAAGWVEASLFKLRQVDAKILVDLSERKITITVGGKTHTGPVAVGSPDHPTPTSSKDRPFYVSEQVTPTPATGPYGSVALGLSARSEVLTEFAGGDGQIGIHGTNDQASIGKPVSNGCVRVPKNLEPILKQVPAGAPVTIQP